jgi:hypothetical protein
VQRRATNVTRVLLACGVAAGPVYIGVGLIEMLTREGFDIRRHALSLLSNGSLGWIHSCMLVGTGLLTLAGALGMRRVMQVERGGMWGPLLIGVYGLGLVGAGFFAADPAFGFPPGTPMRGNPITSHGILHFVCGGIGFLGLIAACMVFARRFVNFHQPGWAVYSAVTGVLYLAAFVGIAAGSGQGPADVAFVNIAFSVAVVLGWAWISAMAAHAANRAIIRGT